MSNSEMLETTVDIGNDGERMTPDAEDFSFFAHLSIYRFAIPFVLGKNVIDAGCGTGYGTLFLKNNGAATVSACDAGSEAIDYCQQSYRHSGIEFETVGLCERLPYADHAFEVIFSSNVMEHLADVDLFLSECCRILAPGGVMIIAVPPIFSPLLLMKNLRNVFHVMNLTPVGWHAKISRFFENVDCYGHHTTGKFASASLIAQELARPSSEVTIRETDFAFPVLSPQALNSDHETISALFVARKPRNHALGPQPDEQIPASWHYGTLVANVIKQEREAARTYLGGLRDQSEHFRIRLEQQNKLRQRQLERAERWRRRAIRAENRLKGIRENPILRFFIKVGLVKVPEN